eukprot:1498911-Pleurochrysis_carterae.AAC.3
MNVPVYIHRVLELLGEGSDLGPLLQQLSLQLEGLVAQRLHARDRAAQTIHLLRDARRRRAWPRKANAGAAAEQTRTPSDALVLSTETPRQTSKSSSSNGSICARDARSKRHSTTTIVHVPAATKRERVHAQTEPAIDGELALHITDSNNVVPKWPPHATWPNARH